MSFAIVYTIVSDVRSSGKKEVRVLLTLRIIGESILLRVFTSFFDGVVAALVVVAAYLCLVFECEMIIKYFERVIFSNNRTPRTEQKQ